MVRRRPAWAVLSSPGTAASSKRSMTSVMRCSASGLLTSRLRACARMRCARWIVASSSLASALRPLASRTSCVREMGVVGDEPAGRGGVVDLLEGLREPRAGHAVARDQRQLAPRLVGDARRSDRRVVVLDCPAAGGRANELDQSQLGQLAYVVADVLQRRVELPGQLARAGDPLVEQTEDPHPHRMRKALDQPRVAQAGPTSVACASWHSANGRSATDLPLPIAYQFPPRLQRVTPLTRVMWS